MNILWKFLLVEASVYLDVKFYYNLALNNASKKKVFYWRILLQFLQEEVALPRSLYSYSQQNQRLYYFCLSEKARQMQCGKILVCLKLNFGCLQQQQNGIFIIFCHGKILFFRSGFGGVNLVYQLLHGTQTWPCKITYGDNCSVIFGAF